jgi:hypothetical protein
MTPGFVSQHDAKQALDVGAAYLTVIRTDITARTP